MTFRTLTYDLTDPDQREVCENGLEAIVLAYSEDRAIVRAAVALEHGFTPEEVAEALVDYTHRGPTVALLRQLAEQMAFPLRTMVTDDDLDALNANRYGRAQRVETVHLTEDWQNPGPFPPLA